jgi:hypothetical protein
VSLRPGIGVSIRNMGRADSVRSVLNRLGEQKNDAPAYRHQNAAPTITIALSLAMDEHEETSFLNVDLDVLSKTPLDGLVEAFGEKVDVLYVGKVGRRFFGAHVEVSGSGIEGTPIG